MKTLLIILLFTACQHPALVEKLTSPIPTSGQLEVQKVAAPDTIVAKSRAKPYKGRPNVDYVTKADFNAKVTDLQGQITKLNSAITLLQTQMKGKADTTTFYFKHGVGGFSGSGKSFDELRQYDGQ